VLTLMDFWFLCPKTVLLRADGELCTGQTTPWECQQCLLNSSHFYHRTQSMLSPSLQSIFWNGVAHIPALARLRGARGMALDIARRKAKMEKEIQLPNLILSHSSFVQQMFEQAHIAPPITHLKNGFNLAWLANFQGKHESAVLRIGYMGQITYIKGVHILIEAFQKANLAERAHLEIWGDLTSDPAYVQTLRQLIQDPDTVKLCGRFQRDELAEVLANIDVLVVPSLWYENAPLVIQEAFAAKTPVIATNLGGMAELIQHEVNGLLFERGDVNDLTTQLQRLSDEPGLVKKLQDGIPTVKTLAEEVTELEALYERLAVTEETVPLQNIGFFTQFCKQIVTLFFWLTMLY
ncbi:MAG TPA: glycosyltransferase, partial [Caldilineaceae bacterium]|nr:glycosyltransferase [Caldilineaceae bacterium]